MSFSLSYLQTYLILISLFSFILYAYDKLKSLNNSKNTRRVSEKTLLLSSLIGGTIGSALAMFIFRHKIKKMSFIIKYLIVIIIQAITTYLFISGTISGL
ncbi:MAG: DUF1294 domain-containing protein [Epsilonproteobacteria bacterium]|nr:MAG: DUF1294 domain-containing protein [Campylobacterota bacterium]